MKKLILIVTLIVFSFAFLSADVYIKQKVHTGAFEMMGQKTPAKDEINEQWIGKNKFAQVMSKQTIIIDLDNNKLFMVIHGSKSYLETSLPLDMAKLFPAQMAQMMSMMKIDAKVTPNGQTKKIGDWNCSGYDIEMNITAMMQMKMNMTVWASTDVPFDWKAYSEKMYPSVMKATMSTMNIGENVINEFKKIKGFQVATEMSMNMMGANVNVTSEVVEISNKTAPPNTYSPPAGYTKKTQLSMMDMQKMK
jgi:hypothetical protein